MAAAPPTPPSIEQIEAKLSKLKLELDPEISYELQNLFPKVEGWFVDGPIKAKAKLLRTLEPKLLEVLRPGERVLYAARGVQLSMFEQMFIGGLWAAMLNQTAFVLTNVRVLMLRINSQGKPHNQLWQIYYNEINKLKGGWAGTISLRLEDGRKLDFSGLAKIDRTTMIRVFEESLEEYDRRDFFPETTQSLEPLCSHCYQPVDKGSYECEHCGAIFWKPGQLALSSLIFPSWGDFLMGHYLLAGFELFGYGLGLFFFLAAPILNQDDLPQLLIALAIFLLFAHGFDSLITYVVARKGLYPRSGPTEPLPASSDH
jgi:hypothetical protein